MTLLEVDGIDAYYGDVQVLWDVDLRVEDGETVCIVGANAAGKTTLLNVICSIHRPARGVVRFMGREVHRMQPDELVDLGLVQIPEGRRLFPRMSVLENLEMGCYSPRARKSYRKTLDAVFGAFPVLLKRKHQLAGSLSGGEQQMLAIGRGLMALPRMLLLDEPSLGLAPALVTEVFNIVRRTNEQGVSILLVEQNLRQALKISSRGYVLESGRIVAEGSGGESGLLQDERVRKAYLGL